MWRHMDFLLFLSFRRNSRFLWTFWGIRIPVQLYQILNSVSGWYVMSACGPDCAWNNGQPKGPYHCVSSPLCCQASWYSLSPRITEVYLAWQTCENFIYRVRGWLRWLGGRRGLYRCQSFIQCTALPWRVQSSSAGERGPSSGHGSAPGAQSVGVLKWKDLRVRSVWGPTDQSCLWKIRETCSAQGESYHQWILLLILLELAKLIFIQFYIRNRLLNKMISL